MIENITELAEARTQLAGHTEALSDECGRLAVAVLQMDAHNKEISDAFSHAVKCVDRIFQWGEGNRESILPDYCKPGDDEFEAVVRLAEDFVRQQNLIAMAIRNLQHHFPDESNGPDPLGGVLWARVAHLFGLGSTSAIALCCEHCCDPDACKENHEA